MQKNTFKIALLNNSQAWGGLEINTVLLAKWLQEAEHQVCLICIENSRAVQLAKSYHIPVVETKKQLQKYSLLSAKKLAKKLQQEGYHFFWVAHSQDIYLANYVKFFSKTLKIIYLQQMYVGLNKKDFLHKIFYCNLDAWISPLPYLRENTLQNTPIKPDKIHIIPLCIETEKFVEPKDKNQLRQMLGLPLEKKIVGTIGRIDRGKGQEFVIEALAKLRAKGYDLDLLIMGNETKGKENTYLPHLKNLAEKLNVTDFVHFREHLQAVELAYATLDFFVVASLEETYGMVTIEAMASRLPVVGVATFGTKELIAHEKTGLHCKSQDANSIAEALIRFLDNPEFAQKIATQAQKEVQEKYSHRVAVQSITKILLDLFL